MGRSALETRRDRLPWGLVGMIGLVALIERGIDRDELSFSTNAAMSWRHGGHAAGREATGSEILCLGDSQVQFQLQPRVIEHRTGRTAYNLGLWGASPPGSYYQLKHALAAGAKPTALVVDFQPKALELHPASQTRLWPELLTTLEAAEVSWTARDPSLFARIALGLHLPSYRDRYEARLLVSAAFRGEDLRKGNLYWISPLWRNWKFNRGATVMPRNPVPPTTISQATLANHTKPWSRDRVAVTYMRRFLALAASRRIPVYWVLAPDHPLIHAKREELGQNEEFTRFARSLLREFPGVTVVDARRSRFPAEVFVDLIHLDRQGAHTFTSGVAEVLARGPDPNARWGELPAYRDIPAEVAIEDLNESRVAMKIVP